MYMLQLERIERRVVAERSAVLQVALSLGADVDLPVVQEAWDDFAEQLVETTRRVVTPADAEKDDLLVALGIRR